MRRSSRQDPAEILTHFGLQGNVLSVQPFGSGHINDTFLVRSDGCVSGYILQRISSECFPHPAEVMQNIRSVTDYLRAEITRQGEDPVRRTLTLLPCVDGADWYTDPDGECWRVYLNIPGTVTRQLPESEAAFREAGSAFGHFQHMLKDYPADTLFETIPRFHHTPQRVRALLDAAEKNAVGRLAEAQAEVDFALARQEKAGDLSRQLAAGRLPLRVTHNDTKLNNVLLDEASGRWVCVVDLDTVMPGLSAYDFGDAIRFGANTALEDERDLSKVRFSLPMFAAYARGYLAAAGRELTKTETESLALGAWTMTYECGIRFLTDYLSGDVYFKADYPEHNLTRARNQLALLQDMERQEDAMQETIRRLAEELL